MGSAADIVNLLDRVDDGLMQDEDRMEVELRERPPEQGRKLACNRTPRRENIRDYSKMFFTRPQARLHPHATHARTHGALTHQRQNKQKRRILSPKDTYQPRLTSERQRPATEPGGAVLEQAAAPLQRCGYARTDGAGAGVDIRGGEAAGARHRANGGGAVLGSEADLACRDLCAHMTRQRQSASVGLVGLFW